MLKKFNKSVVISSPINVLFTKYDTEFLFDLVDKISNPDVRRDCLSQLRDLIIKENELTKINELFNISKLFYKHQTPIIFKQITVRDLQSESTGLNLKFMTFKRKLFL